MKEITICGYVISHRCIRPGEQLIQTVLERPIPNDKKGVPRLLGVIKHFVPIAESAAPRELAKKNVLYERGSQHMQA